MGRQQGYSPAGLSSGRLIFRVRSEPGAFVVSTPEDRPARLRFDETAAVVACGLMLGGDKLNSLKQTGQPACMELWRRNKPFNGVGHFGRLVNDPWVDNGPGIQITEGTLHCRLFAMRRGDFAAWLQWPKWV